MRDSAYSRSPRVVLGSVFLSAVTGIQRCSSPFILHATAVISAAPLPLPSSDWRNLTSHCGARSRNVSCMTLEKLFLGEKGETEGEQKRRCQHVWSWKIRTRTFLHQFSVSYARVRPGNFHGCVRLFLQVWRAHVLQIRDLKCKMCFIWRKRENELSVTRRTEVESRVLVANLRFSWTVL